MFETTKYRLAHNDFWLMRPAPDNMIPTAIIEGLPGEGKTLLLTHHLLTWQNEGVRCCSNYTVRDRITGEMPERVDSFLDVMRFFVECVEAGEHGLVALSEIQAWADARDYKNTPQWFTLLMSQRRHCNVSLIGDTQDMVSVEKRFRRNVDDLLRVRRWKWPEMPLVGNLDVKWNRRPPVFWVGKLQPLQVEQENMAYDVIGKPQRIVMPWDRYGAYDTKEIVAPQAFDPKDKETEGKALEYAERLRAAIRPNLPLPLDEWLDAKERGEEYEDAA